MKLEGNMTEMRNLIKNFKNILNQSKEEVNKLEDRSFEIIWSEKKKKMKKAYGTYETSSTNTIYSSQKSQKKMTENTFEASMEGKFPG